MRPRVTLRSMTSSTDRVALDANPTLGDLAFGVTYGRPEPSIEAIAGAPAIKSATLSVIR
jgi:hypothetical protein